jgi:UPF0716 protein FxsA
MALLFFLFPIVEIYLLIKIGAHMGIANTFFYLLATLVFGLGLIRAQGAFLIRNMQAQLAQGQLPANSVVHSLLIFASGAFFAFPGFISDLVGLFLLLPGTRHLAAHLLRKKFETMMRQGAVRFTASNGFGGFSAGFGRWPQSPEPPMRDVSPLEIDSHAKDEIIDVIPTKKE